MYAGKIVEEAPTEVLYKKPTHPYTVSLLQSIPQLNAKRMSRFNSIRGSINDSIRIKESCVFQPRCDQSLDKCINTPPRLQVSDKHNVACWLYNN